MVKYYQKESWSLSMGVFLGLLSVFAFFVFFIKTILRLVRKKPVKQSLIGIVCSVMAFAVAIAITPSNEPTSTNIVAVEQSASVSQSEEVKPAEKLAEPQSESSKSEKPAKPKETTGQKNALGAAKNYISIMPFSYTGLIAQLEFEKYSTEDATYAANNCGADWNKQAKKAAKNYLDMTSFSKDGLIEQLEFDGFTNEQAIYGAEQNGY